MWLVVQVVPAFILFCGGGGRVHWVQAVQGAGASGVLRGVFRGFLPAFCPLCRFCFGALLANVALFRVLRGFSEGFGVRMYVCMG